jgi:hypothetical protein
MRCTVQIRPLGRVQSSHGFNCENSVKVFQAPMDPTKLQGEAIGPDSRLKEAHEIEWVYDLDDDAPAITNCKSVGYDILLLFSSP